MKNLYIDTNIYLTFFHYSSNDLEELRKLINLIEKKEIKLFLPEQTENEFIRNRDSKIADALKNFKEDKLNNNFPQFCKDYSEYTELKKTIVTFINLKKNFLQKLEKDIYEYNLKADTIIRDLFSVANIYSVDDDILTKGRIRFDLGNPPGKKKSYGDAINWESLLKYVPIKEDIYFISDDKDYYSEVNKNNFDIFLIKEWEKEKESNVIYYKKISEFFDNNYPDINIKTENVKEEIINNLRNSSNFVSTHAYIAELSNYDSLTVEQLNDLAIALYSNSQIWQIREDNDIKEYAKKMFENNLDKLHIDNKKRLLFKYDYLK